MMLYKNKMIVTMMMLTDSRLIIQFFLLERCIFVAALYLQRKLCIVVGFHSSLRNVSHGFDSLPQTHMTGNMLNTLTKLTSTKDCNNVDISRSFLYTLIENLKQETSINLKSILITMFPACFGVYLKRNTSTDL